MTRNNLDGLDVDIPLGVFTAVTGVSGSGKSRLVSQVLVEARRRSAGPATASQPTMTTASRRRSRTLGGEITDGLERIGRLVVVDQKPIGRTPRSNLATYTGLFDHVRKLFAATRQARGTALRRGPILVQRRQGPLRDLPGRRLRLRRTAVPAERVRALPDLPGRALQRQDAGDQDTATSPSPTCWR